MNELIAKIKELNAALVADAQLQAEKGNKAAGTRARKALKGNFVHLCGLVRTCL